MPTVPPAPTAPPAPTGHPAVGATDGLRSPWHLALPGIALIAVCYGLARFAYGLFVPALRSEFALSAEAVGVIGAGSYAGYCLGIVASFLTTYRLGARRVAVTAGLLATAGTTLVAAAPHPSLLATGVLLAGTSTGVASPPLAAAVARWIAQPQRDRFQTFVNAGTGAGVMISGPVALAALGAGHWRVAWAGFALAAVAVTAWVACAVPAEARTGRRGTAPPPRRRARPALGTGRLVTAAATMGAASAAVWVFGPETLSTRGGMSPTLAAWLWVLLGATGLAGAFAGDLVQRVGLRRAWRGLLLGLAAATAALGLLPGAWLLAFVAAAGFGAAYIALTGVLLVWATRCYRQRPAAGVGIAFLAIAAGQIAGSAGAGALAGAADPEWVFLTFAALAVLGAALGPASYAASKPESAHPVSDRTRL